ncbi:hypothetical protein [Ancylobacter oerskovii]|uniref:Uncharacterized protein n=1 Tax=Ancylobacter oerskovii TaxID=459519 RepID=A0ABW4YVP0_9HYPH|nr:hypothetical protein [Ancylobacter oerskovii]MBS7544413.1 hypothetical protein [Ancylobacter oerskovii]
MHSQFFRLGNQPYDVMAGLGPAIHAFIGCKVVDARPKAGHDGVSAGEVP